MLFIVFEPFECVFSWFPLIGTSGNVEAVACNLIWPPHSDPYQDPLGNTPPLL
jgi:hypothetical protein